MQVPKGDPTLVIGQEFLDALPVHQFQYTAKGWRERLVDINIPGAGGEEITARATENDAAKAEMDATGAAEGEDRRDEKNEKEEPAFR